MCSCNLEMEGNLTKTQFWLLVFCAYACMVGQGFIDNVRSVTYPMMKKDINRYRAIIEKLGIRK